MNGWISIKDQLPGVGVKVKIRMKCKNGDTTPGDKYLESRDLSKEFPDMLTEEGMVSEHALVLNNNYVGYVWGGLRVDLDAYVVEWQTLEEKK